MSDVRSEMRNGMVKGSWKGLKFYDLAVLERTRKKRTWINLCSLKKKSWKSIKIMYPRIFESLKSRIGFWKFTDLLNFEFPT